MNLWMEVFSLLNYFHMHESIRLLCPAKRRVWYALLYGQVLTMHDHQMETFSALLAICEANPPVTGGFPLQRPLTRSFDYFFDRPLNKQSRHWWFETAFRSLWRHCDGQIGYEEQSVPLILLVLRPRYLAWLIEKKKLLLWYSNGSLHHQKHHQPWYALRSALWHHL